MSQQPISAAGLTISGACQLVPLAPGAWCAGDGAGLSADSALPSGSRLLTLHGYPKASRACAVGCRGGVEADSIPLVVNEHSKRRTPSD